jgi:hypothetical protein
VVLFGGGCAVPANIEPLAERRYFSAVHYLALTCDDAELTARLRARPAWRNSAEEPFLSQQLAFNAWLREPPAEVAPLLTRLDTGAAAPAATVRAVDAWISAAIKTPRSLRPTPPTFRYPSDGIEARCTRWRPYAHHPTSRPAQACRARADRRGWRRL